MYQRILVATDGSDLSSKAVNSALELAALCKADLVALKVVPRYPHSYFEGGIALQPEEVARVEKQWADEGQAVVDAVQKMASEKGVSAKSLTIQKQQCDLIVMASHGRKGITRLLLGSETQHVLTHATIPVLILK